MMHSGSSTVSGTPPHAARKKEEGTVGGGTVRRPIYRVHSMLSSLLVLYLAVVTHGVEIIPREILFQDPKYSSVSLSPDGKQVGYVAPDDNGVQNVFLRCSSCSSSRQVTFETESPILEYFWTSVPDVILFSQDNRGDENTKIYKKNVSSAAIAADKNHRVVISDKPNVKADIWAISPTSETVLIGMNDENPALHDVYAFDCRTDELKLVLRNGGFKQFFFDNNLNVRLASKEGPEGEMIYYRPKSSNDAIKSTEIGDWVEYIRIQHDETVITRPLTFMFSNNIIPLFDKSNSFMYWTMAEDNDLGNLVVVPFEDPNQKEILYTAQKAQIFNVLVHPIDKTVLAVVEYYHKPEFFVGNDTFLDDFQYLVNLKPEGSLNVISMSDDMSTWLVSFNSPDEPEEIYLYRRWNKKAELFMSTRPELKKYTLNKQVGFDFRARDDMTIQAYLSLPSQASILKPSQVPDGDRTYAQLGMIPAVPQKMVVVVHGGPRSRDVYGFDQRNAWLTNRGYAVLQVNFRGSWGFGKRLTNAGYGEWGRKMHFDILDAVEFSVSKGIANRSEVAIMGASYGGYETLVALTFTPQTFACGVDIVGLSNLISFIQNFPPYWLVEYKNMVKQIGADIDTEEGRQFLKSRSPLFFADRVSKPIMIIQGANDPRVKQAESDQFVAALEKNNVPVTYLLYPDEGHGVRKPKNSMEQHGHIETFLQQCLGGGAQPFQQGQYNSTAIVKQVGIKGSSIARQTIKKTHSREN